VHDGRNRSHEVAEGQSASRHSCVIASTSLVASRRLRSTAFRREPPPRSSYGERRLANHGGSDITSRLGGPANGLAGPALNQTVQERPTRPEVAEPASPRGLQAQLSYSSVVRISGYMSSHASSALR
jgi:hypothetical protein